MHLLLLQCTGAARVLLLAYVVINAVLYSLILPLWEGFDEPFHFAYVQQLANGQGWPDPNTSRLSREVKASMLLAPASHVVKQNMPQVMSYGDYFSLPARQRAELRQRLYEIPTEGRWVPSEFINYEAHHPPLAYLLLAGPERLLDKVVLPIRVAILRVLVALAGSLLLLAGADRLCFEIGMPETYRLGALFCIISCQMIWATIAHVGNDWLAVPVAVWMLVALIRYDGKPSLRRAAIVAVLVSAGLLTKAYFLSFIPLTFIVFALRRRWRHFIAAGAIVCCMAGPWYARNVLRYGVLTATQESRGGVSVSSTFKAASTLDWAAAIPASVRWALWTGNNSFLAFSAHTLNALIAVGLIGLLLWAASRHARAEWVTLFYCASFVVALAYAAVVSYVYTRGAATGPSPWYAQVITAPILALALLGPSRWRSAGGGWLVCWSHFSATCWPRLTL